MLNSFLISSACYQYLQSLDSLTHPHHSNLLRLYIRPFKIVNVVHFLEGGYIPFYQRIRNVIFQMDVNHVNSELTYIGERYLVVSGQHKNTCIHKCVNSVSLYQGWANISVQGLHSEFHNFEGPHSILTK